MRKKKTLKTRTPAPARPDRRDRRYKVGRGRPPAEYRFKPGPSGNTRGRPKGARSIATILRDILKQKVEFTVRGRIREVTIREAIVLRFVDRALQGDPKSATWVIQNDLAFDGEAAVDETLTEEDQKVLEAYVRKMAEQQAKASKK
jgi:hypothetical protein